MGYPNFKVRRGYFFGGMKKMLRIPLSMPNRVIIEPNPPRQGYSHLTWNTLNEYYLYKCMTQSQYKEILQQAKQIAFGVYSINREENKFLENTYFMKLSKFVWFFCVICVMILIASELDDTYAETMQMIIQIAFSVAIGLVFIISIVNYIQSPPPNIFINYESFLRQQLGKYFEKLTKIYQQEKNGLKF